MSSAAKTRDILWQDPVPFGEARKSANKILAEKGSRFRVGKKNCPCGFDMLLVSQSGSLWCLACGLMVPSGMVVNIETGEKDGF